MYEFSLFAILPYFSGLAAAIWTTLLLTFITIGLSTGLGILGALCRTSRSRSLRMVLGAYTEFLRNVPLIVVVYLIFFGLAQMGLRLDGFTSVLIALAANASAYMTEVFRGGLLSINRGQYEAAWAQGMRYHQVQWFVILPQVIRNVFASYGNICVGILLGSSLASIIGVNDLSFWMLNTGSDSFRYMETFLVSAAIYVGLAQALTLGRTLAGRWLLPRHS